MTVFFTASRRGEEQYHQWYDLICETLKSFAGIELISPRLKENYPPAYQGNLTEYQAMKSGIQLTDAVVFETTHESFQLGHETMLALMEKKPVLCLSQIEDFSQRVNHDYFFGTQYTRENLKPLLQDFLAEVRNLSLSKRFNLFLYPHQVAHLQTEAQKRKMNMSEYLRFLINQDR